jgi:chloramphenicol-sensitive protein RarD
MDKRSFQGNLIAAAAYLIWGAIPLYWLLLDSVNSFVVVAYRILCSAPILAFALFFASQRKEIKNVFMNGKSLLKLIASSILLFANFLLYIWGLSQGMYLDVSFGYFITPLMQVLLGVLFLKEKMDKISILSFLLAFAAIVYLMVAQGIIPWFSITLSILFATYGFTKKKIHTDATAGLFLETIFMLPLGVLMLVLFSGEGKSFGSDLPTTLLLIGAGILTSGPMLLYNMAAKRITLITLGFYQYLSPTGTFLISVLILHDNVGTPRWFSFGLIWAALVIYTTATVIKSIKNRSGKAQDLAPMKP